MAHLFDPSVTECKVTISVKHGRGELNESYTFLAERNGREITNQVTDTVLSALHLASAVIRERNTDPTDASNG
jgi:hypothetical protein